MRKKLLSLSKNWKFDNATKWLLQNNDPKSVSLSNANLVFSQLLRDYVVLAAELVLTSRLVHSPHFESGIVKLTIIPR
jgi:hypothetical protein